MVNYTPKVLGIRKEPEAQDVLVRDIMQRAFVSFSEDMDVIEASKMLVKHRITGAPVLNERRELLGFLSEKDCLHFTMDCKYHNNAPGTVSGLHVQNDHFSLPDFRYLSSDRPVHREHLLQLPGNR